MLTKSQQHSRGSVHREKAMQRFIHRENIKHYQKFLLRTTDEAERRRILTLLTEEEAKLTPEETPVKRLPVEARPRGAA